MNVAPLLSVEELSLVFKTSRGLVTALHDVSLQVDKGEIVGVVGESGSGKSVTAYTIMGILDPAGTVTNGRIRVAGAEWCSAAGASLESLRGRVMSMIFQSPRAALNPIRPVGRQIGDVLRTHTDLSKPAIAEAVIELLTKVRIREPERRYWAYPYELSGGMCQRVLIAMALACEPALLIADEPTTGLDVTTQKAIIDLIVGLAAQRDMATILITHDLGLAAQYCDRIVVMQAGRIVESALTTELFRRPRHEFTRKLIAATPRRDSRLADLVPGNLASEGTPTPAFCAEGSSSEVALRAATGPPQPAMPLLEVRDLVRDYAVRPYGGWRQRLRVQPAQPAQRAARFRAVDGISLDIMPGESVGLVGESGCGKSTTAQMIARLLDPTSGSIRFQGEEIGSIPPRQFVHLPHRAQIQMVFQDPTGSLNPRQSAFATVAEPLRRLRRLRRAADLSDSVHELAYLVGLTPELLSRRPHQLSGGQKARVGIARAIALRPKLLLLDEPTSALDVSVQALVLCLLDRLRRQLGMSYLFVSHDLLVVRLLCDRVLVMNSGRIVDGGPAESLLSKPTHDYTRSLIEAVPHFRPGCAA